MSRERIAIDAWGSWIGPEGAKRWPEEYLHAFKKYRSPRVIFEGMSIEQMIAEMDAAGVDRCVLSAFYHKDLAVASNEQVAGFVARHPDRFIGSGTVNPLHKPGAVAREVERLVRELGMKVIRLEPYMYGDGMTGLAPNDKHYWPVYLKCQDLGAAVAIQVGHTGPLLPSECGRPIYLDEVALAFPELTIIGCHLGQPWHEEMMTLAWKHPNVYVETSARTPRHWPAPFVEFTRGWGQDKVRVAWPKRASGVPTDLTEDVVREVALAAGLVDNKVCALDEVWSGLRMRTILARGRCSISRLRRDGSGSPPTPSCSRPTRSFSRKHLTGARARSVRAVHASVAASHGPLVEAGEHGLRLAGHVGRRSHAHDRARARAARRR